MSNSASGYLALNSRNWRRPGESLLPLPPETPEVPETPALRVCWATFFDAFFPLLAGGLVAELLVADILARF